MALEGADSQPGCCEPMVILVRTALAARSIAPGLGLAELFERVAVYADYSNSPLYDHWADRARGVALPS